MTIAAAYLASDGVVLGADSTTTISSPVQGGQGTQVVQLFNHAQKLFEIGSRDGGRFALATWGAGVVGQKSHRTVVAELSDQVKDDSTLDSVGDALQQICVAALAEAGQNEGVGYFLGGCDPSSHNPGCLEFFFEGQSLKSRDDMKVGEARFTGAPEFFGRVFHGYDSRLPGLFKDALKKQIPDLDEAKIDNAFNSITPNLAAVGFDDLPIREAIDYVHTYLHVTIKANKFRFGVPVCGGPIEIGFITTDRRFRWVCHKDFSSAINDARGE